MRHVYIRGILGLLWLAAAVASGVSGCFEMTVLYAVLGGMFLYSSYTIGKKKKTIKEIDKMSAALLTVKNLSAWYNDEKMVLSDFNLELTAQEVIGLIGLNGAGKTTFMKVLSGLLSTFRSEGI